MKHWLETRQVYARIAELAGECKRAALATVVRVRGSAYRHEGAKLVMAEDGTSVGNVSGGCLEQDVREVALRVIRTGVPELRTYCGGTSEIAAWDLGVGCDGEVEILLEPISSSRQAELLAITEEKPFVVLTKIRSADSDQRETGNGKRETSRRETGNGSAGNLSPGELQRHVLTGAALAEWVEAGVASSRLSRPIPDSRFPLPASSQLVEWEGSFWFADILEPPPRLIVVSAGDDARHFARLADEVGFRVVIVDRRPGLLDPARFPASVRLLETDAARLSERLVLDEDSFAVVMTHSFADDTAYLRALLHSPARYIGVLGPRQRTERILGILREEVPVDESRIYGPVGLDIGTDGAEQVGLSILAEVLAVRSGRKARSLRERRAPIHASGD